MLVHLAGHLRPFFLADVFPIVSGAFFSVEASSPQIGIIGQIDVTDIVMHRIREDLSRLLVVLAHQSLDLDQRELAQVDVFPLNRRNTPRTYNHRVGLVQIMLASPFLSPGLLFVLVVVSGRVKSDLVDNLPQLNLLRGDV